MAYSAKVLLDSISEVGVRLTTLEVTIPRIVLAEFNTHRALSRNSASSRAIPVEKRISMVEIDPFIPEVFGKNQKGMQAHDQLDEQNTQRAREIWESSCDHAISHARQLAALGVHKQLANRLIEPFLWHTIIVTATEWDNYFALRCNPDAQPEIRRSSELMREAYLASKPKELKLGQWHTPFVDDEEAVRILIEEERAGWTSCDHDVVAHVSIGRCARVSYLTHDGKRDWRADVQLAIRLQQAGHMSPFEHVARPMTIDDVKHNLSKLFGVTAINDPDFNIAEHFSGNFRGWLQMRKLLPNEDNFAKVLERKR